MSAAPKWIGFAAVAALVVGAGFYATSALQGNAQASAECALSDEKRAAILATSVGEVAAFNLLDTPRKLPPVTFKDAEGKDRTIADWKGRTVLMNLWATWCAPCRKEMPDLQQLNTDLGGETFEVVAVSVDAGAPDKPKAFYSEIGLNSLGFYHDGSTETLFALKRESLAFGLPATLMIDGDGCVLGVLNGPAHWASGDAKALVKAGMPSS